MTQVIGLQCSSNSRNITARWLVWSLSRIPPPLIWVIALDDILKELENEGVKVVAYADDIVILTSGEFLNVISEVAERALRKVKKPKVYVAIHRKSRWC